LTDTPSTLHDDVVRRLLAFALILLVASSAPLSQAGGTVREHSRPPAESGTHAEGPSRPMTVAPYMVPGTPGTWQGRLAPDALASASGSSIPDYSLSSRVLPARFRARIAPPFRDFPLLI
jgi:hypothetical protein